MPNLASISWSTKTFLRPYFMREYFFTASASFSFLTGSQMVSMENGREVEFLMFSLMYALKFAMLRMSCSESSGAYSLAKYSASSAPTLKLIIVPTLTKRLSEVRKKGILSYLRPDGKSQVTVEYAAVGKPKRVHTVVVSCQHDPHVTQAKIKADIIKHVIKPVCGKWITSKTIYHVNPTGRFIVGGPPGDCGVTGRKIIVDTYGGMVPHGGGCFSGKDPTKVDRSAAYMARYIAKNIVSAGIAERVIIQLAYAIGVADPISVMVDAMGTSKISNEKIVAAVKKVFKLRPLDIINHLKLRRPIYKKTAAYGHFGRPEFSWEKTDKAGELRKILRRKILS